MSPPETPKLRLNLATHFTILRILSVPVMAITVYYGFHGWTLIIFAIAALSDALDGFIARVFNQKTWLGALLDPIADKMLLITAFVAFTISTNNPITLPGWLTIVVVFRDVLIVSGAAVIQYIRGNLHIVPTLLSKMTTVCQVVTVFEVALANYLVASFGYSPQYYATITSVLSHLTLIFTVASGLHYVVIGTRMLHEPAD
jgi:cardiolipin synthase